MLNATWNKYISFCLLALIALAMRIHGLDHESLFMDELRQVSYYPYSFTEIIQYAAHMQQPPLDYWIGSIAASIRDTDFTVRLPAAFFGAGAVLFIALLTARIASWSAGIGAGLIYALLPFSLYFSQEARPYAIAIFFMLGTIWSLERVVRGRGRPLIAAAAFLLFETAFLHSRALAPLVVTCVAMSILAVLLLMQGVSTSRSPLPIKRILLAMGLFVLALLLFAPAFYRILTIEKGAWTYTSDASAGFGLHTMLEGVRHFHLFPLWQAFVVQTEPLAYPLLLFLLASGYACLKTRKEDPLPLIYFCGFVCACLLDLFIFQAKSAHMPYRPPYPIYLLPFALISAAFAFEKTWTFAGRKRGVAVRLLFLLVPAVLLAVTVQRTVEFKRFPKKSDWRGLCRYLETNYGPNQVLLFDSLSPYMKWEPTFWGFPRYYHGNSPRLSIRQAATVPAQSAGMKHEPVLTMFWWEEYFLSSVSRYPFMTIPFGMKAVDTGLLMKAADLDVYNMTGFSVIRLKQPSGNFVRDSYRILTSLLPCLPADTTVAEIHLAAARLALIQNLPDWRSHIDKAESLVGPDDKKRVREAAERIGDLSK